MGSKVTVKSKLACKLFGHKPHPPGWWGDIPYVQIQQQGIDGIGRIHAGLYHVCHRCNQRYLVGRIHLNDSRITTALVKYDGYVKQEKVSS